MKALNKTEICGLLSVIIISATTVYASSPVRNTAHIEGSVQQVVITAKRMSAAEKLAYQDTPMQTVVISAKRMSAAEKIAMDNEQVLHVASKSATINTTL